MQLTKFTTINSKILSVFSILLLYSCQGVSEAPNFTQKQGKGLTTANNSQANAYALLIGINKYKHVRNLSGAVNDVDKIKRLLIDSFNFIDDAQHIKVLTNEQATRKAILEAIENHLLAKADDNSVVVLHYSGHGSRIKDTSGDESDDYDETLVPHDSGREPHPNKDITDDELNLLMNRLAARTPNVTFIFDSCHSGTAMRSSELARSIPADERSLPASQLSRKVDRQQAGKDDSSDFRSINSAYVLISGSAAEEESLELQQNGHTFGAMTWFLTDQIRQSGANVTYRDVMDLVKARVTAKYPDQHPQLEGTGIDRLVFNTSSVLANPFILISPKDQQKVTLKAGRAQGVSIGSIYDVFPPGEKEFSNPNKVIAKIKITETNQTTSEGKIIAGGNIQVASRAIAGQYTYANPILRVVLKHSKKLATIKQELSRYKHIEIVQEGQDYDLLLREHQGNIITEARDSEITLKSALSLSDAEVITQVVLWGKWFNILNIKNSNPELNIEFTLETDHKELLEGTQFKISIKNNSNQRLYIVLLDLSSDGQVQIVFPTDESKGYVAPGASIDKTLLTRIPENLGSNSVRDILKIIATTEPTDYQFLEQHPIPDAQPLKNDRGGQPTPFEEFLASSALGTSRGVSVATEVVDPGNWVTLERTIKVLRK